MTKDWYTDGLKQLQEEVAKMAETDVGTVQEVWATLNEIGLMDYDAEKEVIWDRFYSDEDEED